MPQTILFKNTELEIGFGMNATRRILTSVRFLQILLIQEKSYLAYIRQLSIFIGKIDLKNVAGKIFQKQCLFI